MKRALVLLKRSAYDVYVGRHQDPAFTSLLSDSRKRKVLGNLLDRHKVHESAVQKCKEVLGQTSLAWETVLRDELNSPIENTDLVMTVGGDGTLLQASHFLAGSSVPVLGVNSDPTIAEEVDQELGEFDATRSRGFLCGATADSFEQVLNGVLNGSLKPRTLNRISITLDGSLLSTYALNDVLIAHPNPAAVSRCTFSINRSEGAGPLVHSRSSGLRVCTAAGSTAATLSAGGCPMTLESRELQYMLREPILPHPRQKPLMHGFVGCEEALQVTWGCRQGFIYVDGAHICVPVKFGGVIELASRGPPLQVFLQGDINKCV